MTKRKHHDEDWTDWLLIGGLLVWLLVMFFVPDKFVPCGCAIKIDSKENK